VTVGARNTATQGKSPTLANVSGMGGRLRGEPRELGLRALAVDRLPDAEADVRAHAQPGYISDPRVVQLLPRLTNDGGGRGVERELERVRQRLGS
jgi:hypothetical protein